MHDLAAICSGSDHICVSKSLNVTVILISYMRQCGSACSMNDLHRVLSSMKEVSSLSFSLSSSVTTHCLGARMCKVLFGYQVTSSESILLQRVSHSVTHSR